MTRATRAAPTYGIAAWLFYRLLGLVYFCAFASLATQIVGLVGHDGILPAAAYLQRAAELVNGADRLRLLPTLAWISTSDAFLRGLCVAGALLAVLLAVGIAPAMLAPVLWVGYLSVTVVCREFLAYQWDALLLETGLLAAFAAPWTRRDRLRDARDPPRVARLLFAWLLFRLMAGSGLAKLASGDPTWRGLTALSYHFRTQPLPTPLAWYADKLPLRLLQAATAGTLAIEIVAPFAILPGVPRRARRLACGLLIGLQAFIAITGNYAFFNLLAAALSVWMLDDEWLARIVPARLRQAPDERSAAIDAASRAGRVRRALVAGVAVVTVPVSCLAFARGVGVGLAVPLVSEAGVILAPLRSVNAYGLFTVMTTTRPEIVLEGSDDGAVWETYEFRDKPTDLDRPPPWVAPHQPRLDWQMWFAALGGYGGEPWFQEFCRRLLEGSPDVLALLARDPFNGRPPRYLRASLYDYRFSTTAEGRETGAWWTRTRVGDYSPVLIR